MEVVLSIIKKEKKNLCHDCKNQSQFLLLDISKLNKHKQAR